MPNRTTFDEREKFDHSGHPTSRTQPGDLSSPSGGEIEIAGPGADQSLSGSQRPSSRKGSRLRRLDSRGRANK